MRLSKGIDDSFVDSIRINGVVQALVVMSNGRQYEVVAGRRRLHALQKLVAKKTITGNYPVPCTLCSAEEAATLSIVENMHRTMPHPTEYYKSINKLTKAGHSKKAICDSLQLECAQYEKIIRLANIHPRIFKAYEAGKLDESQVKAFGATDDIKKQLAVWEKSDFSPNIQVWEIRRAIQTEFTNDDSVVKYVGLDAYIEAGGQYTTDLFNDLVMIHDTALVMGMAGKMLDAALIQYRSDEPDWKWYARSLPGDQTMEGLDIKGQYRAKTRKATTAQQAKIDRLEKQMALLSDIDESEWTLEQGDHYDELDEKLDEVKAAILNENEYFLKKEMRSSGVVLTIGSGGNLLFRRGLQTKRDISDVMKDVKRNNESSDNTDGGEYDSKREADSHYSQALRNDIALYLRAMTKAQLLKYPDLAVELLNYSMIVDCLDRAFPPMVHSFRSQIIPTETSRNDYEQSVMCKVITEAYGKLDIGWLDLEVPKERIDAYISLPAKTKKALLAYVSASIFERDLDDYIRTETSLDITEYWTPTKDNYFSRISGGLLLSQVRDIVGDKEASKYIGSTKKVIVDYISGIFETKPGNLKEVIQRWVPPVFK